MGRGVEIVKRPEKGNLIKCVVRLGADRERWVGI